MPAGTPPTPRRKRPVQAPAGRSPNAIPSTFTLDIETKRLLLDMATGKSLGAFISGLIRAESARQEERRRLRRLLEEEE